MCISQIIESPNSKYAWKGLSFISLVFHSPWICLNTILESLNTSIYLILSSRVVSNPKIQASYSIIFFVAGCQSKNAKQTDLGMWSPWGDINKTPIPYLEWLAAPSKYMRQPDRLVTSATSSYGKSSSMALPSENGNEARWSATMLDLMDFWVT